MPGVFDYAWAGSVDEHLSFKLSRDRCRPGFHVISRDSVSSSDLKTVAPELVYNDFIASTILIVSGIP